MIPQRGSRNGSHPRSHPTEPQAHRRLQSEPPPIISAGASCCPGRMMLAQAASSTSSESSSSARHACAPGDVVTSGDGRITVHRWSAVAGGGGTRFTQVVDGVAREQFGHPRPDQLRVDGDRAGAWAPTSTCSPPVSSGVTARAYRGSKSGESRPTPRPGSTTANVRRNRDAVRDVLTMPATCQSP